MPEFSPKYYPECGYRIVEYIDENKSCLNCGFKMDGIFIPSILDIEVDMEAFIGLVIIAIITIILLIATLLLFDFCIICRLTELIK